MLNDDDLRIALYRDSRRFWRLACQHDGIDPNSKFIVFSDNNPYNQQYHAATIAYLSFPRKDSDP